MTRRELAGIPEAGLLDLVRLLLSKPGDLSRKDRANLYAVNRELGRREKGMRNARRRERYRVAVLEKRIRKELAR